MKRGRQILFQFLSYYLLPTFVGFGIVNTVHAQQAVPVALERTVATHQTSVVKSKIKGQNNKAGTIIWGPGSLDTTSIALGEFRNNFSVGAPPAFSSQWSAISINQSGGSVTPGSAYWTRNTTGISSGGYATGMTAINSTSRTNGVAIFDSDFLDNGGTAGAFGFGVSPTRHKGELISPSFSLQGYTDTALTLNFFCKWRNFNVSELSASISVDGGTTWTSNSIISVLPSPVNTVVESAVSLIFPNLTSGVPNLSNCKIKFTFDGDYYYVLIDDVNISTANAYDLTIEEADPTGNTVPAAFESVQVTNNAFVPLSQLTAHGLRFGANVKNLGFENVDSSNNASLTIDIQRETLGNWTSVYQDTVSVRSITSSGNGTAVFDSLPSSSWATIGRYRAIYTANINSDANPSNNSLTQNFEINDDEYWSKVELNSNNLPAFDRPLFPGGTNFNRFEYGSVFSTKDGLILDSLSYQYYLTTTYAGSGSQVVKAYVYEWKDGFGSGTSNGIIDGNRTNGELKIVGSGVDSLSGLFASGAYNNSMINLLDTLGNRLSLLPNSHYLVSLAFEGSAFTSATSIWMATSSAKNYAMNLGYSNGLYKAVSNLFLEDGAGNTSVNWVGFGTDVVPSFGLHTSSNCSVLSASINATNISCFASNDGTARAIPSGGVSPYTYLWSNGLTTDSILNLAAGTYTVTITDSNACTIADTVTILEPNVLNVIRTQATMVACFGGNTGSVSISASGGTAPYTYSWTTGDTAASLTNRVAGLYNVTVTDANGCTTVNNGAITHPSALTNTVTSVNNTCNGINNGSASASVSGGTAPYSYLWSDGANSSSTSNMAAGNYTVTVSDANGCSVVNAFAITAPAPLVVTKSSTDVSCNGANDGTITATTTGGTTPYTYQWIGSTGGQTTATVTNLGPGSYDVIVTDANGCATGFGDTIMQPTAIINTITAVNVSCNGGSDGTATVASTGGTTPYTYAWNAAAGAQTTATATSLSAGSYSVVVTDANGCTLSSTATVTEPVVLAATSTVTNVSCNGGSDGTATVASTGGTTPYTYAWNAAAGAQTTATATSLSAGSYSVVITDANGCTLSSTATVTEPVVLAATSTVTNVSCNGGSDGTATVASTGGTTPYTYAWNAAAGAQTTATATSLSAGSYSVVVTDANGCTLSSTATVTEPLAIDTSVTRNQFTLSSNQVGASYRWIDCNNNNAPISGEIAQSFTAAANGSYAVEVTLNGCIDTSACQVIIGVGINGVQVENSSLELYPNPNNGVFTINLNDGVLNNELIQIFNMSGSLVKQFTMNNSTFTFDGSELAEGLYLLRHEKQAIKFIVKK